MKAQKFQEREEALRLKQNQPATILFIAKHSRKYRKQYIEYDTLERANKPKLYTKITQHLGEKAKALASVIVQKLRGERKKFVANHVYIAKVTGRKRRQNLNIIEELRDIFNIEFHRSYINEGKKYRHCYVFLNKLIGQNIASPKSSQPPTITGVQTPFKNNNTKSIRSNILIFTQSFSKIGVTPFYSFLKKIINKQENFFMISPIQISQKNKNTNPKRKLIHAMLAIKKHKPHNGFLGKPKYLQDMQEYLTPEICSMLRSKCKKNFTDNAIKKIMQKVSAHHKGKNACFLHVNGFLRYMTAVLVGELRDAITCSSLNFYIKTNKSEAEIQELTIQAQQERYLNKEEIAGIHSRCDYTQYRAKIAGTFSTNIGYNLLTNLIAVRKKGTVFEMVVTKTIVLTKHYTQMLLAQANAVGGYNSVNKLKLLLKK